MKKWTMALVLAVLASSAWAGFDEGLEAYEKKDFQTALKEFRTFSNKGDARAQYGLGVMYAGGEGVKQDYQEAIRWYRLAAE